MNAQSQLLGATGPAPHWGNLGAWSGSSEQTYNNAAAHLAQQHASAISLGSNDRLLELGAGSGASLRLWAALGVREVITIDQALTQLPADLASMPDGRFRHQAIQAGFDDVWPDLPLVDALISVDALYHARQLDTILSKIAQRLKPAGRWAISTLQIDPYLTRRQQARLSAQLCACGIGWASVWHAPFVATHALQQSPAFTQAGLVINRVDDLSESVLTGFARAIQSRAEPLSVAQRLQFAWWKLSLSARLCRSLMATGHVRYVLISGVKTSAAS